MSQQNITQADAAYEPKLPLTADDVVDIDTVGQTEGWIFGTVGDGSVYAISRFDAKGVFAGDNEALAFVRKRAEEGSVFHKMAILANHRSVAEVHGDTIALRATVTLDIDYLIPKGMPELKEQLEALLHDSMTHMIGNGGLSGSTEAEVEEYSVKVSI